MEELIITTPYQTAEGREVATVERTGILNYSAEMEPNINGGLLLHEGRLMLSYGDRVQDCLCRITFDLSRKYHVVIDCLESIHELLGGPLWFQTGQQFQITMPGSSRPLDCQIHGSVQQQIIGTDPAVYPSLTPLGASTTVDYGRQLRRVNGAVPNLAVRHFGEAPRLTDDKWVFELTPVSEYTFVYPESIQSESYRITHHFVLERCDGGLFSSAEAQHILNTFSTFLAFCAEQWISPVLVSGSDDSGTIAMQEWGTAIVDPGQGHSGWLDEFQGIVMPDVFGGFSALMQDADWRKTIRTAVYWYVRSETNHVGPDGAIILVQAALERLAWHILVKIRRAISEHGFSRLNASDQLRLVLNACSIPVSLPNILAELSAAAKNHNLIDGPEAFVAVRNQIVHPVKRERVKGGRAFFEALQLGKWYLELILLKSFQFNGDYACRLNIPRWAGSVERVPWAEINPESASPPFLPASKH
jgi:hypothetical protein